SKDLDDVALKRSALGFWVRRGYEQDKPRDPDALPTVGQLRANRHLWSYLIEYLVGAKYTPSQRVF
ncbi:MAG: hypothetical protein WCH75_15285, partial [Candidatus Binatia bacterium]